MSALDTTKAAATDALAEAWHADCFRREDHRPHALADCPSDGGPDGIVAALRRDAELVIAWLAADPTRTTGALR